MSVDYVAVTTTSSPITINRPEARNSMDMEHFYQLRSRLGPLREDDDAYVAIVTGVGKDFCVGADLKTYIPQITELQQNMKSGEVSETRRLSPRRRREGRAARRQALQADHRRGERHLRRRRHGDARRDPTSAWPATRRRSRSWSPSVACSPAAGRRSACPARSPTPAAMEFLLCADQIPAARAYEMGVLNEVCRPADLMDRAMDYARRITANGPLAVRKTKESVLRGWPPT